MRAIRKGFTLIELLVVLVVLGILSGIAIARFLNTKEAAYIASMKADLRNFALYEQNVALEELRKRRAPEEHVRKADVRGEELWTNHDLGEKANPVCDDGHRAGERRFERSRSRRAERRIERAQVLIGAREGIHVGEVESSGSDIRGIAVHEAARVSGSRVGAISTPTWRSGRASDQA